MAAEIVEAGVEDWALVRDVRLRALADAPYAFASRLEDERDQPESLWRDRLSSSTASIFLAVDQGEAVGLVIVYLVPEERVRSRLVSMWVSPERRRKGVATALVQAVLDWAQQGHVQSVELWVTETNDAARRLYERCGFVDSGARQPLPSNRALSEIGMRYPVGQ